MRTKMSGRLLDRGMRWLAAGVIMSLAACGASSSPNSPTSGAGDSSAQTSDWRIRFTQSGGFAGLQREMDLAGDGTFTVTDLRRKRQVQAKVEAADLARLRTLLAQAPANAPAGVNSRCNDCFEYSIDATIDGRQLSTRIIDTQLDASGLRPLVNALVDLLTRALAQPAP